MISRKYILIWLLALTTASLQAQKTEPLDTTTFIVMGEGLAAGMANFGLSSTVQNQSFPAQMARQMQTLFPQPLIQGPGLGDVLGYPQQPVIAPKYPQDRVRMYPAQPDPNDEAPTLFVFNLSVPGMKLADSVSRRPVSPLIQRDSRQTAINLILGFPAMILNKDVPLWTQFEYAKAMMPTLVLVELGYFEAMEAAVAGEPARIPDPASFRVTYSDIVKGLRAMQAQVIVTTIPNPVDTAYFMTPPAAAAILKAPASLLLQKYSIAEADYVTRTGLNAISKQLVLRNIQSLPTGSVLNAATASDIERRVQALNTEIANVARESGALLYDLNSFFRRVHTDGVAVGTTKLTADYLGGFYSLDGYYPGSTGHALIANEILTFLNRTYGQSFPLLDVTPILKGDPMVQLNVGSGPLFSTPLPSLTRPPSRRTRS